MSRIRRMVSRDRFFFVTTNLLPKCDSLNADERDIVLGVLGGQRARGAFWLFGYVVMPTHVHVMIYPRDSDLFGAMREMKSVVGLRILKQRGAKGPLWQPRYFDNVMRHVRDFWKKMEYIHNNPVEARLVAHPGDWRWSSYAAYLKGGATPPVPVDPVDLPADGDAMLWNP